MATVSEEQVIKVLRQYNPWWRTPSAAGEENKSQKRLAYYEALKILTHKTIRRFVVLSGARRVGKTTIMYQIINSLIEEGVNPKNIFYTTFDNPVLKLVNVENILSLYGMLYPADGVYYFRKAKDNQKEVDVVVELPRQKILCEVKYRNDSHISGTDAIVELCRDENAKVTNAFLITKQLDDFGISRHETAVPIMRVPAIAFLYLLRKAEAEGDNGKI